MEDGEQKITYFQYFKEIGLPIFVKANLSDFPNHLLPFLLEQKFSELSDSEVESLEKNNGPSFKGRILTFCLASQTVSKHIERVSVTDKYGLESLVPKGGYKVYRYLGMGMMVYSLGAREWELGCYEDFGERENLIAYKSILNRFLSWSLANLGIVGFWGVPVDEGMVVLSQAQSLGEVVFVDVPNHKLLTVDGVRHFKNKFSILRLSRTLKKKNIEMRNEELLSFLFQYCSYFDYQGPPLITRQTIQALSKKAIGLIHPSENFKPRTDLSL